MEAKALTAEEAKKKAVEKYNGEIKDTPKEDDEYHFLMKAATGIYFIKIDARSGKM